MARREPARAVVVVALIDGDTTLHVAWAGIYWMSHGPAKPGRHDRRNEPTYVDGVAWMPAWQLPGDRGHDRSDVYAVAVGNLADLRVELLACSDRRGEDKVNPRDPIKAEVKDGEFVVTIRDGPSGSQWYKLRLSRKE